MNCFQLFQHIQGVIRSQTICTYDQLLPTPKKVLNLRQSSFYIEIGFWTKTKKYVSAQSLHKIQVLQRGIGVMHQNQRIIHGDIREIRLEGISSLRFKVTHIHTHLLIKIQECSFSIAK